MRSDMSQLMVERPRWSGAATAHKRSHRRALNDPRGFDDAPTHESSRREYKHRKHLNENFAPFLRFLRSSVGRRWDDVYSEVRSCLRVDKATDLHVVQHINDFLCTKTWRDDDGDLVGHRDGGSPFFFARSPETWGRAPKFYVDPEGVLRAAPRRRRHKTRLPLRDDVVCKSGEAAIQKNGIWYRLELRPFPGGARWGERRQRYLQVNGAWRWAFVDGAHDVLFDVGGFVHVKDVVAFYGRDDVYAHAVGHQLGKRALKALGLR